eukprot:6471161-Amphidinium_carterae.1
MGDETAVIQNLLEGYRRITTGLEEQNMQVNHGKTGVVASSGRLSRAIAEQLQRRGGAKQMHRFLGVARSAGRWRRTGLFQNRSKEALRRTKKLRWLRNGGTKRRHLANAVAASVNGAALFGAEVLGWSQGKLRKHAVQVARATLRVPPTAQAQVHALLHPDTSKMDVAVELHARVLRLWKGVLSNPRLTDGTISAALAGEAKRIVSAKSPWAKVTGPAASLLMHAIRLEWEVDLAGALTLPGCSFVVDVNHLTSKDLRAVAKRSTENWVLKIHNEGRSVLGRAVSACRQTLQGQSAPGREGLLRYFSGAAWTSHRKFRKGFESTEACALCGEVGTVAHRLLHCPGWHSLREKRLGKPAWEAWAQMQSESDAVPEKLLPPAHWFDRAPIDCKQFEIVRGAWSGITHLYTDGAAARPSCPTTRRAAWAIYGKSHATSEVSWAFGLLPTFPEGNQTVHEAELYAVIRALQLRTEGGRLEIHVDNKAVQEAADKTMQGARHATARHGRLWHMLCTEARKEVLVCRVAAHQREPTRGTDAWMHWWGNHQADVLAKRALTHWTCRAQEDDKMDWRLTGCKQLWTLAASIAQVSTLTEKSDICRSEASPETCGGNLKARGGGRKEKTVARKLRPWIPPLWIHDLCAQGDVLWPEVWIGTERGCEKIQKVASEPRQATSLKLTLS